MLELVYRAVVRLVSAEDHEVEVGSQSRSELVVGVNICHDHELGDLVWKCDLEGLVEAGDAVLRVEVTELNAVEIPLCVYQQLLPEQSWDSCLKNVHQWTRIPFPWRKAMGLQQNCLKYRTMDSAMTSATRPRVASVMTRPATQKTNGTFVFEVLLQLFARIRVMKDDTVIKVKTIACHKKKPISANFTQLQMAVASWSPASAHFIMWTILDLGLTISALMPYCDSLSNQTAFCVSVTGPTVHKSFSKELLIQISIDQATIVVSFAGNIIEGQVFIME
ncbi:Hypothetical_protein [Hexamita inflata]|uniref:Hypothetical_protein n=1 Tax=Hexamita inflata TaxID=28002 RepID=A0AA86R5M3_9EUKA|nr:Hypothetical protein HINF_LOCUS58640 [Hexamita inflata]